MRSPRNVLTEQDRTLWSTYVSALRPLKGRQIVGLPSVPPPKSVPADVARPHRAPAMPGNSSMVTIGAAPAGLDRGTWQRLLTGKTGSERRVDLHGCTAQTAYRLFENAVFSAAGQGLRCIEVITGRGNGPQGGILRRELPLWINLPHLKPLILAATHPHPANPGSVRLLIRRQSRIAPDTAR